MIKSAQSVLVMSIAATALGLTLAIVVPKQALAQGTTPMEETVGLQGGKFGVGFTSSWPAYGLSGTYQLNQKVTAEAILGFLGVVNSYGGRVWYRFKPDTKFDIYAVGGLAAYVYDYSFGGFGRSESVIGFQAGAGVESGLQTLLDDPEMPPIFFNAEISLAFASFDNYGGFNTLSFGAGVHYRFGN